jgi:hypothetical protein
MSRPIQDLTHIVAAVVDPWNARAAKLPKHKVEADLLRVSSGKHTRLLRSCPDAGSHARAESPITPADG